MFRNKPYFFILVALFISGLGGCASTQQPHNYSDYRKNMPRSILVMPPLNDSIEVNASYVYLSTITRPLAEAGYYVFPVAIIDNYMKENGLPTPVEMNAVPLTKIRNIIGADSVLYIHIEEWGQKYKILSSTTVISARAKLVDVKTGAILWEGSAQARQGSSDGGGGLVGMAIGAVINQIVATATDHTHKLSTTANNNMVFNTKNGLLLGPYNAGSAADGRGR